MHKLFSTLSLVAVLAAPVALHATQITGQFSAGGSYSSNTDGTITFQGVGQVASFQGDLSGAFANILAPSEQIFATQQTISYTGYTGGEKFLVYGPGVDATNPGSATPVLEMDLTSFSGSMSSSPANFLNASGSVTLIAAGYDNTPGVLYFTSQGSGNVSFSATANATPSPVPEPSTLALLGTGGLGLAGAIRRRFAR